MNVYYNISISIMDEQPHQLASISWNIPINIMKD